MLDDYGQDCFRNGRKRKRKIFEIVDEEKEDGVEGAEDESSQVGFESK